MRKEMTMETIDWREAAIALKRDVSEHDGFLTIQRDSLRQRFGIGRLTQGISNDLRATLEEHGMFVIPHPYYAQGNTVRVYDIESEIGKIAWAVVAPHSASERPLVDAVDLYNRANSRKDRRSDDVPWLTALDVFLQLVIGRPPEGWEDLHDDRPPYQLIGSLAATLDLPDGVETSKETVAIAGAVCACRPHRLRWDGAPPALGRALGEAAEEQKQIFDRVLREAAVHLLGGRQIPSHNVELGRLGLRYRREAQGGIGWLR
jgi:hypothetical protein